MGKMSRLSLWSSILALVFAIAIYFGLRTYAVLNQGYSWSEMDWDSDGSTTFSEFFASSDIGKRETDVENQKCVEYFSYKDGLPVKETCGGGNDR